MGQVDPHRILGFNDIQWWTTDLCYMLPSSAPLPSSTPLPELHPLLQQCLPPSSNCVFHLLPADPNHILLPKGSLGHVPMTVFSLMH